MVRYDGEPLAILFNRNREWDCVVRGDVVFGAVTLVEGFNSKRAAVEYALKARALLDREPPHSLLSLSHSQKLELARSRALSEAASELQKLGAEPSHIAHLNKLSDAIADGIKADLDAGVAEMFKHRKDVDISRLFVNIDYLRSTGK